MGAGEDYGIDSFAVRHGAKRGSRAVKHGRIDQLAPQLCFGCGDKFRRAMAQQPFVGRKFGLQPVDIALPDRRFGAQQADYAGLRHRSRRLDRGYRADDRHFEHLPHRRKRDRRGGVAGDAD